MASAAMDVDSPGEGGPSKLLHGALSGSHGAQMTDSEDSAYDCPQGSNVSATFFSSDSDARDIPEPESSKGGDDIFQ
jgi:hypothetical protein